MDNYAFLDEDMSLLLLIKLFFDGNELLLLMILVFSDFDKSSFALSNNYIYT